MGRSSDRTAVYVEIGKKRSFAGAIDWPGWCRSGRNEAGALDALVSWAPRYALALRGTRLGFGAPSEPSSLTVVERLKGDATTNFGAPSATPSADRRPVSPGDLRRFRTILRAAWRAFDRAVERATGKELRRGPRGGGRTLDGIVDHVADAEASYLNGLGWKLPAHRDAQGPEEADRTRKGVLEGLEASVRGEIAPRGPRGGVRWVPGYFVRRVAWHALDHAWEIEDRSE